MTDPPLDASASVQSGLLQLTFCVCLFGFFGTIISTSLFMHWSQRQRADGYFTKALPPPISSTSSSSSLQHSTHHNTHNSNSNTNSAQYQHRSNNTYSNHVRYVHYSHSNYAARQMTETKHSAFAQYPSCSYMTQRPPSKHYQPPYHAYPNQDVQHRAVQTSKSAHSHSPYMTAPPPPSSPRSPSNSNNNNNQIAHIQPQARRPGLFINTSLNSTSSSSSTPPPITTASASSCTPIQPSTPTPTTISPLLQSTSPFPASQSLMNIWDIPKVTNIPSFVHQASSNSHQLVAYTQPPQQQQPQQQQQHEQHSSVQYALPCLSPACGRETQIILDWDDTLFPTAYTLLNMNQGVCSSDKLTDGEWKQLQELMQTVSCILLLFVHLFGSDNVAIVTNAKLHWFFESCQIYKSLYAPIKYLLVDLYQIRVISAHDSYSRQKSSAFRDVLSDKKNIHRVICIGDSNEEYDAIENVCQVLRITAKRSISYYRFKLLESPSLNAMIKQLRCIKKFDFFAISRDTHDQSYHFK
eukprot:CAMPEP_0197072886 /NCGR_PEP_ID=MMETSP1384-20130603/210322_1 /TAXON_ID=29189 /ORGANISM="Ammonia sp." /LENGTH=523 /DNA_ID=CAMNT_0042511707 /DNA_START=85 /DNA_END=1656 /DNA_ORIENTATION=-